MTEVLASLFVDERPSKAKVTEFRDANCFLIASTVGTYGLRQMLKKLVVDASNRSSDNALYDRRSSTFDIAFHGISAETPNMR